MNRNVANSDLQVLMDVAYSLAKKLDDTELILPLHTPMGPSCPDDDSDDDSIWSEIEVIELKSTDEDGQIGDESRINFTEEFGTMSVDMPVLPASDSESEDEDFRWVGMSKIEKQNSVPVYDKKL